MTDMPLPMPSQQAAPRAGEALRATRIEAVFRHTHVALLANVLCALPLVLIQSEEGHQGRALVWLGAMIALSLIRFGLCRRYAADPDRQARTTHWQRISVIGSALSGLLWGGGALYVLSASPADQWLWSVAVGGMCAGAVALHSAHPPTALGFTIPACLALVVRMTFSDGLHGVAAGTLILAFILFTSFIVLRMAAEFGRTFSLQRALAHQAAQLNDTNARLTSEIEGHRMTTQMLDETRKMEAVGRLTAGMAHDFNNLLAVILTNLEIIALRSRSPGITDKAQSAIDAVHSGSQLTASLLAFARKQALNPQLADVNGLVDRWLPLLAQAAGTDIQLEVTRSDDPVPARVDAAQLQIALLNLVINARDAMAGAGPVRIEIRRESAARARRLNHKTRRPPGDFIVISVTDEGTGIPAAIVNNVFEPFFTTKGVGQGTGLGLSQVYGFVSQSGGFVDIKSLPGAGTSVMIHIPCAKGTATELLAPTARAVQPSAQTARRVLLVDNHADLLASLGQALQARGRSVLLAQDSDAALQMLKHYPDIGVMVTDLRMPFRSGASLIGAARRKQPDLIIVAMSGSTGDVLPRNVRFLAKPFTIDQLVEAMQVDLPEPAGPAIPSP